MDTGKLIDLLTQTEGAGISSTRFNNRPMFWKKAIGCKIYDYSGNEYIDCTSSYGVMGIGYSHPDVVNAITRTVGNITHTMCEIYPTQPYVEALDAIRKAIGRSNDQVMLTTSGSDAVDVAIKLGYRYTNKPGVIAFEGAFHGQTLNALNYTGQNIFREPFESLLPQNVSFVPFPNIYRNPFASQEELLNFTISSIESTIREKKESTCPIGMIIVEPMQNAGGYIIPPKGFLSHIRQLCNQYNLIMIVDEIFTGFGRCGYRLLCDAERVTPDIVCVGKVMTGGMPAAACVAPAHIMQALDYSGMVPLHGSTYTGNAVVCSSIIATINAIEKSNLINKSKENGDYFKTRLQEIFDTEDTVGDIRGFASAIMIEFVDNRIEKNRNSKVAQEFASFLFSQKIISLISGLPYGNCVAFCLPFIISKDEMDYILAVCKQYITR